MKKIALLCMACLSLALGNGLQSSIHEYRGLVFDTQKNEFSTRCSQKTDCKRPALPNSDNNTDLHSHYELEVSCDYNEKSPKFSAFKYYENVVDGRIVGMKTEFRLINGKTTSYEGEAKARNSGLKLFSSHLTLGYASIDKCKPVEKRYVEEEARNSTPDAAADNKQTEPADELDDLQKAYDAF